MEKPKKENYGWHERRSFDDEPSGWQIEGGEEAYYEAIDKWESMQANGLSDKNTVNDDPILID